MSRLVRTVACPPGHLPPCCLASILDSDPIGCLLPTSPHTPHSAPLSRLIGEAEELSAADNSSPHRGFVGLGFSSRAFPFSTKNGMSRSSFPYQPEVLHLEQRNAGRNGYDPPLPIQHLPHPESSTGYPTQCCRSCQSPTRTPVQPDP